jgi:hypothetical protein
MINEIKLDSDVLLFKYYIIRDNKLNYTDNLNDVFINEKYCHFYKSPSIPHELILFLHSKTNESLKNFDSDINKIISPDYPTLENIFNLIK